jgi:hypothetical protein
VCPFLPRLRASVMLTCDPFPKKEISLLTMYMSRVLDALLRSRRALAFRGWSTYRTSTLRQTRHPSFIVARLPVRPQSARHTPLPQSFGPAQCSDMRTSSSRICLVWPHLSPRFTVFSLTSGSTISVARLVEPQSRSDQGSSCTCALL